jgi:geranylgeranyl pyrophosphate synthase
MQKAVRSAQDSSTGKEAVQSDMIESGLQAVEAVMSEIVESDVSILQDASHHILDAGGKRVRPRLLLLSYLAMGGEDIDYAAPAAAAVELVHTASMVHDDINDHGAIRRGRPSVNAIWGRTFALLTGDFLFTKVYELMAPYRDLNILLAEATVALVEGETLQASAVKEGNLTRERYQQIIARKTAALFKASTTLGARLVGADEAHVTALGEYGYNIGLAFQIVDDILDLTADSETLGKTAGIDIAQGKGFLSAYDDTDGNNGATSTHRSGDIADDPIDAIRRKMLEGDTLAQARTQAQQLMRHAVSFLDDLPPSDAANDLRSLAVQLVERQH